MHGIFFPLELDNIHVAVMLFLLLFASIKIRFIFLLLLSWILSSAIKLNSQPSVEETIV